MELRDLLDILDGYEIINLNVHVAKHDRIETFEVEASKRSLLKMIKSEYLDDMEIAHAYTEINPYYDEDGHQVKTKMVIVCKKNIAVQEPKKLNEDGDAEIVETASENSDFSYPYPTCNVACISNLLGVARQTVCKWVREEKLKAITEIDKRNRLNYKITLKDLNEFLNNNDKYMKKYKERVANGDVEPILSV